jgi:HEAT repeat protein
VSADATLLDSVIACIQAAISSSAVDPNQKREAVWFLRFTPGGRALDALRIASGNPDMPVKLEAMSALLSHNDLSRLQVAAAVLIGPANTMPSEPRQNLIAAIYDGVKDERAVPALAALLSKASDPKVRQAAAMALRNTAAQIAVEPLSGALTDPDEMVRYFAVIGLAEIEDKPKWRPLLPEFRSNEANYLQYWNGWVAAHKSN